MNPIQFHLANELLRKEYFNNFSGGWNTDFDNSLVRLDNGISAQVIMITALDSLNELNNINNSTLKAIRKGFSSKLPVLAIVFRGDTITSHKFFE